MKMYNGLDGFEKLENAVVTSGTFDGVHIGHQQILNRLKEVALMNDGETVLITFWPHPRLVLFPDEPLFMITSIEERARILRYNGIDHLIIIPFTREFAEISSDAFIKNILVDKIGTKKLVIGYNHRFGKNRSGSFDQLKLKGPEYGFEVEEISKQMIENVSVSSTKIRHALETGDVNTANKYLGHTFNMTGTVIRGDKIGRQLGFPTANLRINFKHKLIPSEGIYAVRIYVDFKRHDGMLNIGYRPTFNGTEKRIEVHIFDFSDDIYNKKIMVEFFERVRSEKKFNNTEELKAQLNQDRSDVIRALNNK